MEIGFNLETLYFLGLGLCATTVGILWRFLSSAELRVSDRTYKHLYTSWLIMTFASCILSSAFIFKHFFYDELAFIVFSLSGIVLLSLGILHIRKVATVRPGAGLRVIDWTGIEEMLELKRGEKMMEPSPLFIKILERLSGRNVILFEIGEPIGVYPVFRYLFQNLIYSSQYSYCLPIIGAITPYDIYEFVGKIGRKSAFWVSPESPAEDWVNERFVIAPPSDLFEITSFITTASKKTSERIVFIGDFLDEIFDQVSEREFHSLTSKIQTIMKSNDNIIILLIKRSLYSKEYLAILERYADATFIVDGKKKELRFIDLLINEEEFLGRMEFRHLKKLNRPFRRRKR